MRGPFLVLFYKAIKYDTTCMLTLIKTGKLYRTGMDLNKNVYNIILVYIIYNKRYTIQGAREGFLRTNFRAV